MKGDARRLPPAGSRVEHESEITLALLDTRGDHRLERLAAYGPDERSARRALGAARKAGFETLFAEHRQAWARRWETADVVIEGDPELQRAVRFALFHLMASVADEGEAAVGARGLSGPGYQGHVFWDSDVFVLPFLAATHPPAARAMLEYRLRRLDAARAAAAREGYSGARFPWESAREGEDVTPSHAHLATGELVPHPHRGVGRAHHGRRRLGSVLLRGLDRRRRVRRRPRPRAADGDRPLLGLPSPVLGRAGRTCTA